MTRILIAGAACAALLAACSQSESPGQSEPANAAQDAASAVVGTTSAATLGANTVGGYIASAAMGDMYEIQSSQIALEKSQNAGVKAFAQMLVTDHTAASNMMKQAATQAASDVTPPTELDERRKGMLDNLRAASAADFDRVYLAQQVAAHREAVTLHEGFSDNTDAAQLAAHATNVLPKIRAHLVQAERLAAN